jgi:hypothetical protein
LREKLFSQKTGKTFWNDEGFSERRLLLVSKTRKRFPAQETKNKQSSFQGVF